MIALREQPLSPLARVRVSTVALLACAFLALLPSARACAATSATAVDDSLPASSTRVEWSMTYASKYLFHGGFDYSEGRPVLQPQLAAGWRGLSLQTWGNWDQTRGELNELDATILQSWERGVVSGEAGVAHLRYPNRDWERTQELIANVAIETRLEPTLDVHWDVDEGDGAYWAVGLSQGLPIPRGSCSVTSKLYGLEHYYGQTGVTALETGLSVTSQWGGFTFEPSVLRQWTWENRDLAGENRIAPGWLLSLTISPR